MKKIDKKARQEINKKMVKDATKNVAKDAGKAMLQSAIMSAAATLIKTIIDSLINYIKEKKKSWNLFVQSMKKAISNFFSSLEDILKNAASGGIVSIVNNVVSLLSDSLKKCWGAIKTGFSTIKSALKVFTSIENKNKPFSIRLAEFGKIITIGLVSAGVVLLSEGLTNILEGAFPVLKGMIIPIIGTVTGLIVEIFLAIIGGILIGLVIDILNKFIAGKEKNELDRAIIDSKNKILKKQQVQIELVKKHDETKRNKTLDTINKRHEEANKITQAALDEIFGTESREELDFGALQDELNSI